MGLVHLGIPKDIVSQLGTMYQATAFVETGTFRGETARWAAEYFDTVHTIEKSEYLYKQYSLPLSSRENIHTHLGDSRDQLPDILDQLGEQRSIYWLDGHWSGHETAGEGDECPLMAELIHNPNEMLDYLG